MVCIVATSPYPPTFCCVFAWNGRLVSIFPQKHPIQKKNSTFFSNRVLIDATIHVLRYTCGCLFAKQTHGKNHPRMRNAASQ